MGRRLGDFGFRDHFDLEWARQNPDPFSVMPISPPGFSGEFGAEETMPTVPGSTDVFTVIRENWLWIAALLLLAFFIGAQQKR